MIKSTQKSDLNTSLSSNKNTKTNQVGETNTIQMRHNRFDGFDVYSVLLENRKILFHKEVLPKPYIVGNTFKVLGVNGNLWLCENIETKEIHIGPNSSFILEPTP